MPSAGFPFFFEVFAEGVVMVVSAITTVAFGARCLKSHAPLNVTGLLASLLSIFYSIYGLTYWFNGMDGYNCTALAAVNGTCMSASNALTFLHLFIKARTSNKLNRSWTYWQMVGIATTLFNWVTLAVVHALLTGEEVEGIDGPRCKFTFEMTSFKLKWIAQFINQTFQVVAFVLPLWKHVQSMRENSVSLTTGKGGNNNVFASLVVRAIVASQVSLTFTTVVTVLVFAKIDDPDLVIPVFALAVLDNAVNLGAIYFALNINSESNTNVQVGGSAAAGNGAGGFGRRRGRAWQQTGWMVQGGGGGGGGGGSNGKLQAHHVPTDHTEPSAVSVDMPAPPV